VAGSSSILDEEVHALDAMSGVEKASEGESGEEFPEEGSQEEDAVDSCFEHALIANEVHSMMSWKNCYCCCCWKNCCHCFRDSHWRKGEGMSYDWQKEQWH